MTATDPAAEVRARPIWLRLILSGLICIGVAAVFGLGVWQLQRRVEKMALIDRVDARISAIPIAAPPPTAWPDVTDTNDEYLRVRVSGYFLNDSEILVQAVTEQGAGDWVLTPFVTDAGFTVLVNRGFIPPERRDPSSRHQMTGTVTITGLLRLSEPKGGFLRSNDPAANRWYSRDVAEIAAAHGLGKVAPYFIDADATPNPGGWPIGGLTVIRFANNHLVYALTWFTLGLGLIVGGIYVWRR